MMIEPAFLATDEVNRLIEMIMDKSVRNPLLTGPKDYRTSSTAGLSEYDSPLVRYVERRIAAALGLNPSCAEGLFGSWYRPGESYRVHHDAFYRETPEYEQFIMNAGNRVWSAMVYLNTVNAGGETVFPHLGVRISPRARTLVAWPNLMPDGEPDQRMMHAAEPPVAGDKFIVTLWFRLGSFR